MEKNNTTFLKYGQSIFDDLMNREEKNDFLKIIEDEYYCSCVC